MHNAARIAVILSFLVFGLSADQLTRHSETPPHVLRFSASLGRRHAPGAASVTFAIYRDQEGGTPLWLETQIVNVDEDGRFDVVLGTTREEGVPTSVFNSGEGRWLGIQVVPEVESPRILLASVPYAFKAADADTLGGKPLSAFVLVDDARRMATAPVAVASITTPAANPEQPAPGGERRPIATGLQAAVTSGVATGFQLGSITGATSIGFATTGGAWNVYLKPSSASGFNSVDLRMFLTATKLSVLGEVESASGGIRFPDGTLQSTAAIGGTISSHGSAHVPGGTDPIPTGAPVTIGTSNAPGSAISIARSDHVHSHGDQPGGTLHAGASAAAAGFLSAADKVKIDAATNVNNANTLVMRDASGNFSAATITSNLTGNATTATTATSFTGSLAGDVSGPQAATVVNTVAGQSAASVASATTLANAATSANTPNTFVRRDASGNFSAGTITANLDGIASMATNATTAGSSTDFSGSLSGDVTGTQAATVVSVVGGQAAASVASATLLANGATAANGADTIVKRDASGNFVAGTIAANLAGNASTATSATNFSGSLAGNVTGTQGATVVASVGGQSAANVAGSVAAVNGATNVNTANSIVKRDGTGNFAAGTITANLTGNASTATTATNFSGSLAGNVTGTQGATVVASVGGQSAANVAGTVTTVNGATNVNTPTAIPGWLVGLGESVGGKEGNQENTAHGEPVRKGRAPDTGSDLRSLSKGRIMGRPRV